MNYEKIEVTSAVITMNMDSSTVYAHGVEDSLGVKTGTPVFKDGETPYETNTIRYNFKSKKGVISNCGQSARRRICYRKQCKEGG